jgi:hypothetical protein
MNNVPASWPCLFPNIGVWWAKRQQALKNSSWRQPQRMQQQGAAEQSPARRAAAAAGGSPGAPVAGGAACVLPGSRCKARGTKRGTCTAQHAGAAIAGRCGAWCSHKVPAAPPIPGPRGTRAAIISWQDLHKWRQLAAAGSRRPAQSWSPACVWLRRGVGFAHGGGQPFRPPFPSPPPPPLRPLPPGRQQVPQGRVRAAQCQQHAPGWWGARPPRAPPRSATPLCLALAARSNHAAHTHHNCVCSPEGAQEGACCHMANQPARKTCQANPGVPCPAPLPCLSPGSREARAAGQGCPLGAGALR